MPESSSYASMVAESVSVFRAGTTAKPASGHEPHSRTALTLSPYLLVRSIVIAAKALHAKQLAGWKNHHFQP